MSTSERRTTPRVPFASLVSVRVQGQQFQCRTRDIGGGGLFIYFDTLAPEIGAELLIVFRLAEAEHSLEIAGRVARHETGGNGVGVAFVEIGNETRAKLARYIAALP